MSQTFNTSRMLACFFPASDQDSVMSYSYMKHALELYDTERRWYTVPVGDAGNPNGRAVAAAAIDAYLADYPCATAVGPGTSSLAAVLSPMMILPTIGFRATSVEFSVKERHPWYSRVIPSDNVAGKAMAEFVGRLGWRRINTVCYNDAYGRSVMNRFAGYFSSTYRGTVIASPCVDDDATDSDANTALDIIERSPSRIVVVGISTVPANSALMRNIIRRELWRDHVFVFSEATCSFGDSTWHRIPGALCITYTFNETSASRFAESFSRRNFSGDVADLERIGHPHAALAPTFASRQPSVYTAMGHDAIFHMVASMDFNVWFNASFWPENQARFRQRVSRDDRLMTGTVELNHTTGDRLDAPFRIAAITNGGQEEVVAVLDSRDGILGVVGPNNTFSPGLPAVWWFGQYNSRDPPPDIVVSGFELSIELLSVAIAGVVVASVLVIGLCVIRRNRETLLRVAHSDAPVQAGNIVLSLVVMVLKVMTTVALALDGAKPGYLVSYTLVMAVGVANSFIDIGMRGSFIFRQLESDDGMPIAEEQRIRRRLQTTSTVTTLVSNVPTVLLCGLMLSDEDGEERFELLLTLGLFAAFSIGVKIGSVPAVIKDLVRAEPDEKGSDAEDSDESQSSEGDSDHTPVDDERAADVSPGHSTEEATASEERIGAPSSEDDAEGDTHRVVHVKGDLAAAGPRDSPQTASITSPGQAAVTGRNAKKPSRLALAVRRTMSNGVTPSATLADAVEETVRSRKVARELSLKLRDEGVRPRELVHKVLPDVFRHMDVHSRHVRGSKLAALVASHSGDARSPAHRGTAGARVMEAVSPTASSASSPQTFADDNATTISATSPTRAGDEQQ